MSFVKYPAVVSNLSKPDKKFILGVKKSLGNYDVYDYDPDFSFFGYVKRKYPSKKGTKEDIDLYMELLDALGFKVKRVSENEVLFVNPEIEEYETIEVPLYTKDTKNMKTIFSYLGTTYVIENVPTKESIRNACIYQIRVEEKIKKALIISEIELKIENSPDFVSCLYNTKKDLEKILNSDDYLVFHISRPYRRNLYYNSLVIDKKLAKEYTKNGVLKISVPEEFVGVVIGKGGKNCKEMSEKLGLRAISIVCS